MNPVPAVSEVEPACVPADPASLLTIFAIALLTRAIYPENLNMENRTDLPPDLISGSFKEGIEENSISRQPTCLLFNGL